MDFDDNPPPAPTRTTRFAPKSAKAALKPPKSEPAPRPKLEALEAKAGPQSDSISPGEQESKAQVGGAVLAKAEASISNGTADMEVDSKLEVEKAEPMETEEEDGAVEDEIVREIDVFFNASIDAKTQLYVVQYPLRTWWRPYELDERCEEVRVKPRSAEVEVDLSIDVESRNYDTECSSQLKSTKQTLTSSWKPPCATSYAVGILIGNKLHLNPIHSVVQLRPSMEHLYPEGSKMKNYVTSNQEGSVKMEGSEEKAGPSRKQGKQLEPPSKEETDEEEHWVPLVYHGAQSDLSARYIQKLVTKQCSPIHFAMNPNAVYLLNTKVNFVLARVLLSLPLDERIKKILCEAPYAHRYSALRYYAPDVSDEVFLGVLQKYGILVQGCWVAKTSLVVKDPLESLARDYILLGFSKDPVIRKSVLPHPKALSDHVKKFLNIFAVERPSLDDWKFKQPTDVSFLKKHPDIVNSQSQQWENNERKIMDFLNKKGRPNAREENNMNNAKLRQPRMVTKEAKSSKIDRTTVKDPSRTTMSSETREALPKALQKVFQNQKAVSESTNPKADARMARNAAQAVDSPEELREVLNRIAVNIHGFYVLKSSPDHPELDPLRRVVMDLFIGKGPEAKLKKGEVIEAAKISLKRDISKNEFEKVITDICESKGSFWVLNSGN
ncbi:hypothetical protein CDL15_Pgr013581 [Punica granatum]|uniref:DNA-directed RNA polymerase III subunit RPC5 n=1 Tax=Punica granatum TaxID=22663 RepID=A0A218W0L0_PUNGR|nr:hypothetical protein CDL15_Pgr013581 [Punica granatum]